MKRSALTLAAAALMTACSSPVIYQVDGEPRTSQPPVPYNNSTALKPNDKPDPYVAQPGVPVPNNGLPSCNVVKRPDAGYNCQ